MPPKRRSVGAGCTLETSLSNRSDGTFQIVGRKKDLIITSGFNVYPSEVEEVLREAEGVLDAAVIGCPDAERGEIVTAHVVLKPGANWNEQSLARALRGPPVQAQASTPIRAMRGRLAKKLLGQSHSPQASRINQLPTEVSS